MLRIQRNFQNAVITMSSRSLLFPNIISYPIAHIASKFDSLIFQSNLNQTIVKQKAIPS